MIESVAYGTYVGEIISLPDSVAKAWLDYLGIDERLKERDYVSTEEQTFLEGEFRDLIIYCSSQGYHLSVNPEE